MKTYYKTTKILILSAFLIFTGKCYSQEILNPSYIINNQSDTIKGMGVMGKNQKYCFFHKDGDKDTICYNPREISAFRIIDGSYYISMQIPEKDTISWYFLEYLVDGEIDLFALHNEQSFYIKNDTSKIIELNDHLSKTMNIDGWDYGIKDLTYLGYLRYYMQDAPQLFKKIDNIGRLSQQNMVKLAVDYHNAVCDDYKCINYTKRKADRSYSLEAIGGYNYHNNYISPYGSILFHITPTRFYRHIYLSLGILYSDQIYRDKKEKFEVDYLNDNSVHYHYTIKLSGSLKFVLGNRKLKPFISFGLLYGSIPALQGGLSYPISKCYELSLKGSIDGFPGESRNEFNNSFGHSICIGVAYKIK